MTQPALEQSWKHSQFARDTAGLDIPALAADAEAFLADEPATTAALGRHLAATRPGRPANSLAYTIRFLVPVVQVPPRGPWGARHQATWTTLAAWLGEAIAAEAMGPPDDAAAVLRYLAAFGPASVADMQTWSWRTRLAGVFEGLRPRLVTFRDEGGVELFDLPDAPRPDPDTLAPARFLPEYDNLLLSHRDRSRFAAGPMTNDRLRHGSVLVDGDLGGSWRLVPGADGTAIEVRLFAEPSPSGADELAEEAGRLLAFLTDGPDGGDGGDGAVRIRVVADAGPTR